MIGFFSNEIYAYWLYLKPATCRSEGVIFDCVNVKVEGETGCEGGGCGVTEQGMAGDG